MIRSGAVSTTVKVLLVEDHPDTAETRAVLLRLRGHEVGVAPDGPTALRMAADSPPHVAVLDIGLPGGADGCDVARWLRDRGAGRKPLVIAVTGRGSDVDRHRLARAGVHLYLRQPVDAALLARLLEQFKAALGGECPLLR
jgi:DNA-binding response OmpR family regulator